ncbi:HAD-IC family P-type ATPase [Bombilactobacillus folatiphilus]|uniref:HAD-IC family P-type ATPase n=1 Tax=Bombilactobacillus folatiphilus TaxID=2923362 RepID=A0ABY4P8J5_9LACO|nr:HAD-IC family P-type ATPase [Bombilactobacillus folatiphilus]UQS82024.1 HAD-IC family P-type ATPase [Bombilactobacillus folatiphilus]
MRPIDVNTGLTHAQVQDQSDRGNLNQVAQNSSTSIFKIISKNLCTLFNLINLVIAILIFTTGSYSNLFFLGPVITNFLIGTYQEIHAKKQLDRLTLLNRQKVLVLRDGQQQEIFQEELVLHDLIILQRGNQVPADGTVRQTSHLEVDESNLTGESAAVLKATGEQVLSGSLIISGQALIELTAVGDHSFANRLASSAKNQQHNVSKLLNIINQIIKIVTLTIIPLSVLLFWASFQHTHNTSTAILGTSASIIGMIPQGLVLLTSVALAVGAVHLSRKQVLVKSMTALEALARVDTLCLDKTGTITTGNLKLADIISIQLSKPKLLTICQNIIQATNENNETAQAILAAQEPASQLPEVQSIVAFSSERKWSAVNFQNQQSFAMGAPNFILQDTKQIQVAQQYAQQGLRVLAVVQSASLITDQIDQPELLGYLLIQDEIRPTADSTFKYLHNQGLNLKVISGDDPSTVKNIATQIQLAEQIKAIDMSTVNPQANLDTYAHIAQTYNIFGRTLPEQKQKLIQALQQKGHQVAMTGDGVNDVLAMRQSDCGVAIAGNSDAAESAADFVLLNQNFDSLIYVLNEGRRVINNIERVAALYLIKTMYSALLTVIFICLRSGYPFHPAQMTPVNALTVGIPTFFLALQPDFRPPEGRFYKNVLQVALPAALDITLVIMVIVGSGQWLNFNYSQISTLAVWAISLISFAALWTIARPLNRGSLSIFIILFLTNLLIFIFWGKPFELINLFTQPQLIVSLIIVVIFYPLFRVTRELVVRYLFK